MRAHWIFVLAGSAAFAGLAAATAAATSDGDGERAADWTAKAKQAWSNTCQKCHTAPDPQFESGRAFLHQVKETS